MLPVFDSDTDSKHSSETETETETGTDAGSDSDEGSGPIDGKRDHFLDTLSAGGEHDHSVDPYGDAGAVRQAVFHGGQ